MPALSRRRFLSALPVAAGLTSPTPISRDVTVATYNLGLGANLFRLLSARSVDPSDVYDLLQAVVDSRFPARADAIARLLVEAGPSLVGIQEAALVRRGPPEEGASSEVVVDFLAELRRALAARNAGYRVVVVGRNADEEFRAEAPDGTQFDVRLTDRDVILVREDVGVTATRAKTFDHTLTTTVNGEQVSPNRGYCLADCSLDGVPATFVTTHLSAASPAVRQAQAEELVTLLTGRDDAVVLAGDVNSPPSAPDWSTYDLLASSFTPAAPDGGPTCCQLTSLENTNSRLSDRLDEVFVGGPAAVERTWRLGETPSARVEVDGRKLWPSDHAGVAARLSVSASLTDPTTLVRAVLSV